MVATILIVAITVVLAAVLYVMIVTLTHSPAGTAPLGSVFAWGSAANATGVPTVGCATVTHYCYHIDIASAGNALSLASITLALQLPSGSPTAWPTSLSAAGGTVRLMAVTSPTVLANFWVTNSTWQLVAPFGGAITSGYSVVLYGGGTGETANQGLSGVELVAVGSGAYSGTVPSLAFT